MTSTMEQTQIIGKMLIGVTEEISAMCGAIDSCCDERVDKLVNDSIGKQILHGPYPDQPEDSG